jgi:transposase
VARPMLHGLRTDPRSVTPSCRGSARIGIETGSLTPWLVHELRGLGFEVICLDARHARAAVKMQINKNDLNVCRTQHRARDRFC